MYSNKEYKVKKLINFKDLEKAIKDYADKFCEGNYSLAVRELVREGLFNKKESKA